MDEINCAADYADEMRVILARLVGGFNEYLEDFYAGGIAGDAEELLAEIADAEKWTKRALEATP